jgi:hypothetical protein
VTTNHDSDDLIERFRVALHTVEQSPSDETIGELRSVAAPIIDLLRAEYQAAENTDGDCTALFRWLRAKLADRESAPKRASHHEMVRHQASGFSSLHLGRPVGED